MRRRSSASWQPRPRAGSSVAAIPNSATLAVDQHRRAGLGLAVDAGDVAAPVLAPGQVGEEGGGPGGQAEAGRGDHPERLLRRRRVDLDDLDVVGDLEARRVGVADELHPGVARATKPFAVSQLSAALASPAGRA